MMNFGVIGYGYWGPNIVRNLMTLKDVKASMVADLNPAARGRAQQHCSGIEVTGDANEVLRNPAIDAVAIVSPVGTHYDLAKTALENGKHVFVEKPFTTNSQQAEKLIELAEKNNLRIMVDYPFLFTGAVKKIRQLIDEDAMGNLYYYDSTRVNLGLFQHDVNVLWDLACHDLSIVGYLSGKQPEAVSACGQAHLNTVEDVAYLTLYYPDKFIAHINVNWLSPVKVRMTLIGGEKKMLVWNDLENSEKLKIYDKGVDVVSQEGRYELLVRYRSGDMWSPELESGEALRKELAYFVDCIRTSATPFNDGRFALHIVKALEAASTSLSQRGSLIYL